MLNLDELEAVRRRMIDADAAAYDRARSEYNATVDDNWLPLIAECRELREINKIQRDGATASLQEILSIGKANGLMAIQIKKLEAENERLRKALEEYLKAGNSDIAREALSG